MVPSHRWGRRGSQDHAGLRGQPQGSDLDCRRCWLQAFSPYMTRVVLVMVMMTSESREKQVRDQGDSQRRPHC